MKFLRSLQARLAGASGAFAVLPVLRAQLRETALQAETAVTQVCGRFQAIAERSRSAVARSAELLGSGKNDAKATVERTIETSRKAIGELLERIEHAGRISTMAVTRMQQIEEVVRGMEAMLRDVDGIAFRNKLVALNAKIEAVHVGKLGAGFEVVADEIAKQADRSRELSEGIGAQIGEIRRQVTMAADELRTFAAGERAKVDHSRHEAESALQVLQSVHENSHRSLEAITEESRTLTAEIASAVIGLQFQDRMNQRIGHVIEALEQLEAARPAAGRTLLEEVKQGYTMDAERAVLSRTLEASPPASAGDDVELF